MDLEIGQSTKVNYHPFCPLLPKSVLMVGLRGVGKTVLLDRMREDAEATGVHTLRIEAKEKGSLPAILVPRLRQALLRLSRNKAAKDLAHRALRGLAGFAKALKVKYGDIEVGLDMDPEPVVSGEIFARRVCDPFRVGSPLTLSLLISVTPSGSGQ